MDFPRFCGHEVSTVARKAIKLEVPMAKRTFSDEFEGEDQVSRQHTVASAKQ
jgi:hypothetical protein